MITFKDIRKQVNDTTLSKIEENVLIELDKIVDAKIRNDFASQDTIYVPSILFYDIFRKNSIPSKRQRVILIKLISNALDSGWNFEIDNNPDNEYYLLTPKM